MPGPIEYLTGNSFIVYPFKDESSLRDITLTFLISNDCFLDALVVSKSVDITKAYLYSFTQDGVNFVLSFRLLNDANSLIATATITKAIGSVVERQTFTYSDSNVAIKIVPGKAFVDLGLIAPFSYTFLQSATQVSSTAFVPYIPSVTNIDFYNIDPVTNLPILLTSVTDDDLQFEAGTNIDVIDNDGAASLDVIAGAGTGLFDGCDLNPGTIKSINFIPSNEGRFFLLGDGCYTHQRNPNGLLLSNICKPKCTSQQIVNYGHYHNRIKDGIFDVGDYAETVKDAIVDQMNDYNTNVVPTKTMPKFNGKFVQTTDGSTCYFSFAVGIFNPSDSPISVDMHIVPAFPVVPGMEYFVMEHTPRITLDDTTCYLPTNVSPHNIDLVGFMVPCIDFALLEFVVSTNIGVITTLTINSNIQPLTQVFNINATASVC